MDVRIGDCLMGDFGLKLLSVELGSPQVKENKLQIPGRNGVLDLTEAVTGYPVYGNVTHKLTFDFRDGRYDEWVARGSELKGKLHGRRLRVVLGEDGFYYDARVLVQTEKLNQEYSKLTVELDAAPYKLALRSSVDDWIWDTFCFERDVIREYRDLEVPAVLTVVGGVMPSVCVFDCSQEGIVVACGDVSCTLPQGRSIVPDILIREGEQRMEFLGSGRVSVEYREGRF